MGEVLGQSQVVFIQADSCLVLDQDVDVSASIWFWRSEVTSFFDFFSCPCSLLDLWLSLVNLLTNGSETVVVKGDRILLLCAQNAQYVAGADVDFMWSAVLDWHSALIPLVKAD